MYSGVHCNLYITLSPIRVELGELEYLKLSVPVRRTSSELLELIQVSPQSFALSVRETDVGDIMPVLAAWMLNCEGALKYLLWSFVEVLLDMNQMQAAFICATPPGVETLQTVFLRLQVPFSFIAATALIGSSTHLRRRRKDCRSRHHTSNCSIWRSLQRDHD